MKTEVTTVEWSYDLRCEAHVARIVIPEHEMLKIPHSLVKLQRETVAAPTSTKLAVLALIVKALEHHDDEDQALVAVGD